MHKTVQRIPFRCAIDATKKRVSCKAYEEVAPKPRFEVRESSLVVTLPFVEEASAGLSLDEATVMHELSSTLLLSRGDIERRAGFSKEYRGCLNGYYYLMINDEFMIGYDVD